MTDQNKLATIVKQSGLTESSKIDELMKNFTGYFNDAKAIVKGSKDIVVTDESQTDIMVQAREQRLELKRVRVEVEKTRKQLKEQSLREGKAIDGIANVIKALIVPVEQHLEKQEKFIETQEELRIEKQYSERVEKLSKYADDLSMYNVKDMSDEAFEILLAGYKKASDDKIAAEEQAEKDRLKKEKKDKLHNARKNKLIPIWSHLELERQKADFGELSEKEFNIILSETFEAKKVYDYNQDQLRKENEKMKKKLDKERKAKEAQLRKEFAEKGMAEAKEKAEAEAKQKALLAPDKVKLNVLADQLDKVELPAVQTNQANEILRMTRLNLSNTTDFLREKAKAL